MDSSKYKCQVLVFKLSLFNQVKDYSLDSTASTFASTLFLHHAHTTMQVKPVLALLLATGWLGSRVVSVLDSGPVGHGFKLQPRHCRVTVLGKLFTPIVPLFKSSDIGSSPLKGCEDNCGAWRKVMAPYRRVYDSRHLQADCQEPESALEPYSR